MQWVNSLAIVELTCDRWIAKIVKFRNFSSAKVEIMSFLKSLTPCCDLGTQGHPSIELFPGVYIMTVPNGENIRTAFVEGSKKNCPLYRQILSIYAQIWRLTLTIDLHHSFNLCKLIRMQICTYISNLNLLWQIMSVFAISEDLTFDLELWPLS